jgi:ssDNA-binding Zn-finger/Zn-ribbon topoisomerase 1
MNCPQCKSGELVERRNKRTGQIFYGCDRYPACKFAVASLDRLKPSAVATTPEAAPKAASEPIPATSNDELIAAIHSLTDAIRALAAAKEHTQ